MGNVKIVAFGHRARHGKDYLARRIRKQLIRETDVDAVTLAFGNDLKAYCRVGFGMREKNGKLLQVVGSDVFRAHVDPDIWVECLRAQVTDLERDLPDGEKCVVFIPDMRFPNEMRMVKALGGLTVRVTRFNADGSLYVPNDGRDPNHISEVALADAAFDLDITAVSGDFDALHKGGDAVLEKILRWVDPSLTIPHRAAGFTASI